MGNIVGVAVGTAVVAAEGDTVAAVGSGSATVGKLGGTTS